MADHEQGSRKMTDGGQSLRKATSLGEASEKLAGRKRRRRKRRLAVAFAWAAVAGVVLALLAGGVAVVRMVGHNRLRAKVEGQVPSFQMDDESTDPAKDGDGDLAQDAGGSGAVQGSLSSEETEEVAWKEGWVRYNDKIYEYNDEIMTFLVMGIDINGEVEENPDAYSGGQADALFLVVVDRGKKKLSVIAVNRDTEVDVKLFDVHAEGYEQTVKAQIAVQHSFGDGKEFSCELTRDAVSELFYGLPINGYLSVNMAAIAELNDAVGGVELTVLEDLTKKKKEWTKGAQVTLEGEEAFWYVKWRDITVFESNRGRLARQKQYLDCFLRRAKEAVKEDLTLPVSLYQKLGKYIVTDISLDQVAYLAGEVLDYSFSMDEIYTLEGTTQVVDEHERFYPDRTALKELMLQVFYREVQE